MVRLKGFCYLLLITLFIVLGLLVADYLNPLKLPNQSEDFASVVLDRDGEPLRTFADKQGVWRYEISVDDVSPRYLEALIGYEDQYFYQHFGVNPFSLGRAAMQFVQEGRVVSGGSTLTMQVARILYPHPRTVTGKLTQIFRAFQLEWHLSKTEIMELYLNYAPFGGTLEGVQAASLQYLHKPVSSLRYSEAALLAVLPQAPSRLRPDRHPKRAESARNKVLERMLLQERWDELIVTAAKEEQIAVWPLETPSDAPLLSRRLHRQLTTQRVIKTTIDLNIQTQFQDSIQAYVSNLPEHVSASVILVDNRSSEVLSYVGSADFYDDRRAGHVDMATAVRSPGSTLKPFLFGLAIDANLVHSESLLADVPRVQSHYRPGNFSQGFSGPVSASQALIRSLNLPFVQLIEAYGSQNFVNKLHHVGVGLKIPQGEANPTVILGGAGFSLEKLVTAYSAFANDGYVRPLQYLYDARSDLAGQHKSQDKSRRLLTPESAWITWNALQDVPLPLGMRYGLSRESLPPIGWKTGTSWDYRDVWAVGVSKDYTLGVWLGRPDGKPMGKTMGSLLAGPLLFNLFGQIDRSTVELPQPENVEEQSICWPDGRRASLIKGTHCHIRRSAYISKGSTPRTLMPGYQWGSDHALFFKPEFTYQASPESGLRISMSCMDGAVLKTTYLWPDVFDTWLRPDRRKYNRLPAFDPNCKIIQQSNSQLRVTGVNHGQVYHVLKEKPLSLRLKVEGATGKIFWYLNGDLQDEYTPEILLTLDQRRDYELFVQDKSGRIARLEFKLL